MAFKDSRLDREQDKFRNLNGDTVVAVQVDQSALPSGAATSAKQDEQSLILDSIDQNTANTVGQLLAVNTELNTQTIALNDANQSLDNIEAYSLTLKDKLNSFDTNVGTPSANTLRTAAMVQGQDADGNFRPLRVNKEGEIITHGEYQAVQNPHPSSTGIILHERQNNPTDNHQTLRQTAVKNGQVTSADVSVMDSNGLPITSTNRLPVTSVDILDQQIITAGKNIGTTAVRASVGTNNLVGRKSLAIYNNGSSTIFYGGSGVTTTNGIPIKSSGFVELSVADSIDIFLITTVANINTRIAEAK